MRITSWATKRSWSALAGALALALTAGSTPLQAQEEQDEAVVGITQTVGENAAGVSFDLEGGERFSLHLEEGRILLNGEAVGEYREGGELERNWRNLLQNLGGTLNEKFQNVEQWDAPAEGNWLEARIKEAAREARQGVEDAGVAITISESHASDSIRELNIKISELEQQVERARVGARDVRETRNNRGIAHFIGEGIKDTLTFVALYMLALLIGFATVYFGGGKYLENTADVLAEEPLKAGLVGLAASFLVLPIFVLGIIGLALTLVGILVIPFWAVLFPIAVGLATAFGYLAVGHALGEAVAKKRFYGGRWFQRANSYYYLASGLAILLVAGVVANLAQVGGPWFGFIEVLFSLLVAFITWAALLMGMGGVLISRFGTRGPADLIEEGVPME